MRRAKVKRPHVHDLYDPPGHPGIDCSAASLPADAACRGALQDGKDDADINVIMSRVMQTGSFPAMVRQGEYADISAMPEDYLEAVARVQEAGDRFRELPPKIRSRFSNDPFYLLSFLADPANRSEAEDLGLIEKRGAKAPLDKPPEGGASGLAQ